MTSDRPVESIEGALSRQDRSFLFPLSLMSADEIIEARSGSGTVLSLLVSALFIPAEDQKMYNEIYRAFADLYDSVVSVCASVRDSLLERVLKKTGHMNSLPSNANCKKEKSAKSCETNYVHDDLVSAVADGIGMVAGTIEEARKVAMAAGTDAYEEHRERVSNYLRSENVVYTFDGAEHRKNSLDALVLQYLFNTRYPERQLATLEPVKRFLLGFSEYSLDVYGARSVHYALSMCGGAHEETFLREVVRPLMARAQEQLRLCGENAAVMRDADNNTLMHYAASSIYGSDKAVAEVIRVFGFMALPKLRDGRLSIAELFINNIPYYALFYSISERSRAGIKGLAAVNCEMREALAIGDMASLRKVSTKRFSMFCRGHTQASELRDNFLKALCILLRGDEKIRGAQIKGAQGEHIRFMAPEILRDVNKSMRMIYSSADAVSNDNDIVLSHNVRRVFDDCDKRGRRLGARVVASDVARAVLCDPAYIRRIGITASYTADLYLRRLRNEEDRDVVLDWEYDRYSQVVNGFLGSVNSLCKSSVLAYARLQELYESTRTAIELCKKNKTAYDRGVKCSMAVICVVAPLALLSCNAFLLMKGMSTSGAPIIKTCVVNAGIVAITLIFYAYFEYCNRSIKDTERAIAQLGNNFTQCVNEYLSVISEALPVLEDRSLLYTRTGGTVVAKNCDADVPTAPHSGELQPESTPDVLEGISLYSVGTRFVGTGETVSHQASRSAG